MFQELILRKKSENPKDNILFTAVFCFVFFICFVGSLFYPYFVFVCFIYALFFFLYLPETYIFAFLLFTFPCGLMLKYNTGEGTSLFTYLEFIAIIVILLKRIIGKRFKIDTFFVFTFILLMFEVIIGLVVGKQGSLKGIVKLFNIIFLFYLFCSNYKKEDKDLYFYFFLAGLIATSIIGFFKTSIPRVMAFHNNDLNVEWINGKSYPRFSGLYNDPNYYSIPVVLSIIVLLKKVFVSREKGMAINILLLLVCLSFGALTLSKSFILILGVVLLCFCFSSTFKRNISLFSAILIIGLIGLIIFNKQITNFISIRFLKEGLTSGRIEIWNSYLYLFKTDNYNLLFFGNGLSASPLYNKAIHNMYIETIFEIGILGLMLYFVCLGGIVVTFEKEHKFNIVNWLGFICVFLMFFFLEGLTEFEFPFYLMMCFSLYCEDLESYKKKFAKQELRLELI